MTTKATLTGRTLYYFPLEPYIERYTWFLSAPNGWFETSAREAGFTNLIRIDGKHSQGSIKKGEVLDYVGRSRWAMSQVDSFLELIQLGVVKDGDMLYVEDFWHAGIEAIFYARQFGGPQIKIGTFIHAQSIDETDFMYRARRWARDIEVGFSYGYDALFTTSPILKTKAVINSYCPDNIHVTGLPFNSKRLLQQLNLHGRANLRDDQREGVLFSSRFDDEKNPFFFMEVAERLHKHIPFYLVAPKHIDHLSNDPKAVEVLKAKVARGVITLIDTSEKKDGLGKLRYYDALRKAKVQFNCAKQDWTSWTLLEACLFGACPVYPIWKDFPRELEGNERHLYEYLNVEAACSKIMEAYTNNLPLDHKVMANVVERHDQSTAKALNLLASL